MEKLISMVDFVAELGGTSTFDTSEIDWYNKEVEKLGQIRNYAKFLKQPLQLVFFVTCDSEGNFLEEPKRWQEYLEYPESFDSNFEWYDFYEYQEAKERVLFDDFEVKNGYVSYKEDWLNLDDEFIQDKTIEYLIPYKPKLTPYALKQIGITDKK